MGKKETDEAIADSRAGRVAGRFGSVDELLADLKADDTAENLDNWLHEKAGPAHDALKADPARAVSADRVRYTLDELLAEADASGQYPLPPEEREWVDAPAVGREWPACEVRARLHDDAMAEAFRKDPAYAVELLNSILEDGDQDELLIARRQITEAFSERVADIALAIALARRVDAGLDPLTPFDPAEHLTTAEAVAALLADAEATGDAAYIEHAHQVAARARTMHGLEE
ncbi:MULTISPECIES: hypothetical protein [Enterobacteriaceae]|uniref:hypothetical protein n=1 Tax=Enterobacteriaceae TaxID=543 RepID=UPI003D6F3192